MPLLSEERRRFYSFTLILFFLCLINIVTLSQTGPGGVGNDTTNLLWLRADAISGYNDGDPLDTWIDTSGNQNHGEQTGTARPSYETNIINGLPAIYFDGVDDYIDTLFTIPSKNMTIFTVFAHKHNGISEPNGPLWVCDYNNNLSGFYPLYSDGNYYLHYGTSWLHKPSEYTFDNWHIAMVERGNFISSVWKNNIEIQSTSFNNANISKFSIGRRDNNQR